MDVEIFICFDFDGNLICIPTNNGLHLLKSQEIPLCDKHFPHKFSSKSYLFQEQSYCIRLF